MKIRAKVEHDIHPVCDWLALWETSEKYYGGVPSCPECECEMDYVSGHMWRCSDNCDEYNGDCTAPQMEWDGSELDKGKGGVALDGKRRVPFDEYKRTYGDPSNYVNLFVSVETKCDHCGEWAIKDSFSGITFYEHDSAYRETGTFTEGEVDAMPEGYLRETLHEMFDLAKSEAA